MIKHPLAARPGALRGLPGETLLLPIADRIALERLRERPLDMPTARNKIWELHQTFHCSIIGTCLTTGELRGLLVKLKAVPDAEASDHALHAAAVTLASARGVGAKLLNKTLDRKFQRQIARAAAARTEDEVRGVWDEALEAGDIPGGYWVVMTHPASTQALVRHVFGEVHMLSHLVGAANRADIRRLRELEAENAALREKVERQQAALRDAIVARDRKIAALQALLGATVAPREPAPSETGTIETGRAPASDRALDAVLDDTRGRLQRSERRVAHLEARIDGLERRAAQATERATAAEAAAAQLRDDCRALDTKLAALLAPAARAEAPADRPHRLNRATILYVGGRPNQLAHLRAVVEQAGGAFLHHSGGSDETTASLPGCVSRADAVLFPVDCVSHAASLELKRLCKQAGKPYLPLRTASLAALLQALDKVEAGLCAATA
jgi:hypothetical protein